MTATTEPVAGDISLDDLDWWTRPTAERDAFFAHLRADRPHAFFPERSLEGGTRGRGFTAITRYADIQEVSRRPDEFRNGSGVNIFDQAESLREHLGSFIAMDNPEHARLRKIVSRGFTNKNMEALRDRVTQTSAEILAEIAERGECDFVTEYAALLPLRVIDDLLGIPREYEKMIFDNTNIVLGGSDPEYIPDQTGRSVATKLMGAANDLTALLNELARDRIANPREDLISLLVAATTEENLTPQELASFFILLVGAGNETTRNAIAHTLVALTQFPDQKAVWQNDLVGVTPTAVDEALRWASPVLYMRRTVENDNTVLGDTVFNAGDKVVLWYRSGNQDETVFEDATSFIATRKPNPHIAFGAPGPHFCLGSHLARLEIGVAYQSILKHLPDIHAVAAPEYLRSNFIHGIKHLKAEFTPTSISA